MPTLCPSSVADIRPLPGPLTEEGNEEHEEEDDDDIDDEDEEDNEGPCHPDMSPHCPNASSLLETAGSMPSIGSDTA